MINRTIILAALMVMIFVLASTVSAQQKNTTKILEGELKQLITRDADCADENKEQLYVSHLEYFDFNGDGSDEAVVVASTCNTGTAGPDVHAVYTRDAAGKIVELPFPHIDPPSDRNTGARRGPRKTDPPQGQTLPVFGNPNYTLRVEQGQLVARWGDSSERENPLVVWFKWDGKAFVVDHMKAEGPFPTSYDCAKATKEMDRAICYAPTVAPLDAELGKLYRGRMQQLAPDKKQELQNEQRAWLAQREKQCVIYKWWVDCLKEMYGKRIEELKR